MPLCRVTPPCVLGFVLSFVMFSLAKVFAWLSAAILEDLIKRLGVPVYIVEYVLCESGFTAVLCQNLNNFLALL